MGVALPIQHAQVIEQKIPVLGSFDGLDVLEEKVYKLDL